MNRRHIMRKLAVLATIGIALVTFGCTGQIKSKSGKTVTLSPETKVKCPKCGSTFSVQEGVDFNMGP